MLLALGGGLGTQSICPQGDTLLTFVKRSQHLFHTCHHQALLEDSWFLGQNFWVRVLVPQVSLCLWSLKLRGRYSRLNIRVQKLTLGGPGGELARKEATSLKPLRALRVAGLSSPSCGNSTPVSQGGVALPVISGSGTPGVVSSACLFRGTKWGPGAGVLLPPVIPPPV